VPALPNTVISPLSVVRLNVVALSIVGTPVYIVPTSVATCGSGCNRLAPGPLELYWMLVKPKASQANRYAAQRDCR
jgi:hypothetical protein